MMQRPPFKTALGISTGDLITTSYGTGPYEVWEISGPVYFFDSRYSSIVVRDHPVISLTLIEAGTTPRNLDADFYWINAIRREGDRWLSGSRDEVFVQRKTNASPIQGSLFDAVEPPPAPYPFQEGVVYPNGIGHVWRCDQCKRDFNAARPSDRVAPDCPVCGSFARDILVMCRIPRPAAAA